MESIQDIFKGKVLSSKQPKLIIPVEIDTKIHKEGILRIARSIEPDFEQGSDFMQVLTDLFNYFTGKALNSNKGIWISGTVRTSKTFLFDIFKKHKKLTHVLTNLYPKQYKELVDVRSFSRMQEIFN